MEPDPSNPDNQHNQHNPHEPPEEIKRAKQLNYMINHGQLPATSPLPDWLSAQPPAIPHGVAALTREQRELMHMDFGNIFSYFLECLVEGENIWKIFEDDPRGYTFSQFMRWVFADPERENAYNKAAEMSAELLQHELIPIADGIDTIEEIDRAKLRIATRKDVMAYRNKKKYGNIKQVEQNININVQEAMQEAENRIIEINEDNTYGEE